MVEAAEAAKKEADYTETVSDLVSEIADLQSQINLLSLDDSREAAAQRASLEEELAELQSQLADEQADYALEAYEDALQSQSDAYSAAKDEEISTLESSISSTQKLYDMAVDYIEQNWDTLLTELTTWNYEMGSNLEEDLVSAFEAASLAAEQWGYNVQDIIDGIAASMASIDSSYSSSSSGSDSSTSSVVGTTTYDTTTSNESLVKAIVQQMKYYSKLWNSNNSAETNASYHEKVVDLAAQLAGYGVTASYDSHTGEWTIDEDSLNPSNVGRLLYNCYHSGGIVQGDSSLPGLKDNEVLAVLEEGEAVLDEQKKEALYDLIDFVTSLSDKLSSTLTSANMELISDSLRGNLTTSQTGTLSSVEPTTATTLTFGDTYIYGTDGDTVDQHVEVNRKFVNTILKELNIR